MFKKPERRLGTTAPSVMFPCSLPKHSAVYKLSDVWRCWCVLIQEMLWSSQRVRVWVNSSFLFVCVYIVRLDWLCSSVCVSVPVYLCFLTNWWVCAWDHLILLCRVGCVHIKWIFVCVFNLCKEYTLMMSFNFICAQISDQCCLCLEVLELTATVVDESV